MSWRHRTSLAFLLVFITVSAAQLPAQTYSKWASGSRVWYINTYLDRSWRPSVIASAATWNDANSYFFFSYNGLISIFPKLNPNDGVSVVDVDYVDMPESTGAETIQTFNSDGTLHDADLIVSYDGWINGWFSTSTPTPSGKLDLQSIVTHEMGHMAGLPDDDGNSGRVMFSYAYTGMQKRQLHPLDINTIVWLYGPCC